MDIQSAKKLTIANLRPASPASRIVVVFSLPRELDSLLPVDSFHTTVKSAGHGIELNSM
jgi:hypothetical protein